MSECRGVLMNVCYMNVRAYSRTTRPPEVIRPSIHPFARSLDAQRLIELGELDFGVSCRRDETDALDVRE